MLRNYFKVMLRSLLKNKVFTLINLLGLATGMAVCLLLVLYIQNELGYTISISTATTSTGSPSNANSPAEAPSAPAFRNPSARP